MLTIHDFNARVQAVHDAHTQAFGYPPSPALTVAIARNAGPHEYPGIFSRTSRVQAYAAMHAPFAERPGFSVVDRLAQAARTGDTGAFVNANTDDVANALADPTSHRDLASALATPPALHWPTPPQLAKSMLGVIAATRAQDDPSLFLQWALDNHDALKAAWENPAARSHLLSEAESSLLARPAQQIAQAIYQNPLKSKIGRLGLSVNATVGRASGQIVTGLVLGPPTLAIAEVRGVKQSVEQRSLGPLASTNVKLAKGIAQGIARDVTHPKENAGFLFLDALGLLTVGASLEARLGAAGTALRGGEGAAAVTKALARKPRTGTYHLAPGAEQVLSQNPLIARIQTQILDHRAKAFDERGQNVPVPAGATSVWLDAEANSVLDGIKNNVLQHASYETKIGRELRVASKLEQAMRMSLLAPLDKIGGSALASAKAVDALPGRWQMWRRLSPVEQKAIQLLATDDAAPVETWRAFHQQMIDAGVGDASAHAAQLALIDGAEKVLANPNPTGRFATAVQAVRDVVEEQERIKIDELGLSPIAAEARIARVGRTVRGEEGLASFFAGTHPELRAIEEQFPPVFRRQKGKSVRFDTPEGKAAKQALHDRLVAEERAQPNRISPESFYLPFKPQGRTSVRAIPDYWGAKPGPYGIPLPQTMPELTHEFTGDSIRAGTFRIDATGLAREAYAATVRTLSLANAWRNLHDNFSVDHPTTNFDVPIRSERAIPDELRRVINGVDSGAFTSKDVEGLSAERIDEMIKFLYPSKEDAATMKDVRWIDSRLLGDTRRVAARPGPLQKTFAAINEPLKALYLFVRPAYALNLLGNAGMGLIEQGVYLPHNLLLAARSEKLHGERVTGFLDAMAGEGRVRSYAPDVGKVTKVSHALAAGWNVITDRLFRRAAVIHELRKLGIDGDNYVPFFERYLARDPEALSKVKEASERAKEANVKLDNLTWFEREHLRHVVFVYPWVSRSFVWSLQTILDHPLEADAIAHIGAQANEEFPSIMQKLPGWAKDIGYVPVGFDAQGRPKVQNFSSINTFSTLSEALGLVRGDSTLNDLLGPGADLAIKLVTDRDRFGRQYKHAYLGPVLDSLSGLPQWSAVHRYQQTEPVDKPLDLTKTGALVTREHIDTKRPIFVPQGFWASMAPLAIGGLAERVLDPRAVNARFWQSQPYADRHAHEVQLVKQLAQDASKTLLGKNAPAAVKHALTLTGARELAYKQEVDKLGRTISPKEKALLDIGTLEATLQLSTERGDQLRATLKTVRDDQVDTFRTGLVDQYAGGKALKTWHHDVTTVASFNSVDLDGRIADSVKQGIIDKSYQDAANAPEKTLHQLGRVYLAYEKKIRGFHTQAATVRKAGESVTPVYARLRAYQDTQDQPVKIDGHSFPSLPRLAIGRLSPAALAKVVTNTYTQPFEGLSAVDKSLLGLHSDAKVSQAWADLKQIESPEYLRKNAPDSPHLDAGQKLAIAKQLDAYHQLGGTFVREWRFARLPRFQQYKQERIYTQSPNKALWNDLFTRAKVAFDAKNHDAWDAYVPQLRAAIQQTEPAFYMELKPYLKANPSFLDDLLTVSGG